MEHFNPLPRERENAVRISDGEKVEEFNPLPRERENGAERKLGRCSVHFNPLPRERENPSLPGGKRRSLSDFNPLPRERENYVPTATGYLQAISIHSLVRGRTW